MKYESELIKEIVDSRGHKKSSSHYESECIETWIEEAKGAYPKLCDYETEWLNYISILDDTGGSEKPEPPIGEFPYVALTDVTEGTVDNVVPYAYKTAILNGNTLINISNVEPTFVTINDASSKLDLNIKHNLQVGKKYAVIGEISEFNAPVNGLCASATHVVKTVELTVVNQDGETMSKIKPVEGTMHLSTSSDTIPPLFSGEIPVEAITQNLSSFIVEG